MRRTLTTRSFVSVLSIVVISAVAGCRGSDTSAGTTPVNSNGPRITAVQYIDLDSNGVDADDIMIVTFDKAVYIGTGAESAFEFGSNFDALGTNASVVQSVPGSVRAEVTLGTAPSFVAASSTLDIVAAGSARIRDENGETARPAVTAATISDFTTTAPTLVAARYSDSDLDGTVNVGDTLLCEFDKPITVPAGATVANNFEFSVTNDVFGGGASVEPFRSLSSNRGALITLGTTPKLTVSGTFDAAVTADGSPSNVKAASVGAIEITDTLAAGANDITADTSVDVEILDSNRLSSGREGSVFLGNVDATSGNVTAHGYYSPGGAHHYLGNVTISGSTVAVDLFCVADTANNRVLIYDGKPSGNNADATVVLGQSSFSANGANQSDTTVIAPTESSFSSPEDVHYHAPTNQLFVSDSGNHRVLVWSDVFDGATGALTLGNADPADLVIGQFDFLSNDANQGMTLPTSRTLSNPQGIHAAGGQLAIADTGNNRVLLWSSIPTTNAEAASVVLGQTNFAAALVNGGGAVGAATLSGPADVFIDPALQVFNQAGGVLVADSGNNRVLLYGTSSPATGASADAALGQVNLTSSAAATTAAGLSNPTGVVALDGAGGGPTGRIFVADQENHRVMAYTFNPDDALGAAAAEPQSGDAGAQIAQAAATDGNENRGSASATAAANSLAFPSRVALDEGTEARLFVADRGNHRLLEFGGPPVADTSATIVQGQPSFVTSQPNGHLMHEPTSVAFTANQMFVADTLNSRVLIYTSVPTSGNPTPNFVVGQNNVNQTLANQGAATPSAATLNAPEGVATDGTRLVVADTGNNRVLIYNTIPAADGASANVVLGQAAFTGALPNSGGISGARLFSPVDVAISGTKLIICDRDNHRVLIYNDITTVSTGSAADIVVGQDDFTSKNPNQGNSAADDSLDTPVDAMVVSSKLYIVDQGNNRVLVYATVPSASALSADSVLGQSSFVATVTGSAASDLNAPTGVASDGTHFIVSDGGNNRVLLFKTIPTTKANATSVLGQPGGGQVLINQGGASPSATSAWSPQGVFYNGLDLWFADRENSRVVRMR